VQDLLAVIYQSLFYFLSISDPLPSLRRLMIAVIETTPSTASSPPRIRVLELKALWSPVGSRSMVNWFLAPFAQPLLLLLPSSPFSHGYASAEVEGTSASFPPNRARDFPCSPYFLSLFLKNLGEPDPAFPGEEKGNQINPRFWTDSFFFSLPPSLFLRAPSDGIGPSGQLPGAVLLSSFFKGERGGWESVLLVNLLVLRRAMDLFFFFLSLPSFGEGYAFPKGACVVESKN